MTSSAGICLAEVHEAIAARHPDRDWVVWRDRRLSWATFTDDELRAHCARDLARYKIPKDFVRREFVQRSPSGKPDYGWARAQLDA